MFTAAKQCTKCRRTKSLDEFPRDSNRRDGRGSWCRVCKRAVYRAAAREKRAARREEGLCVRFGCPSPAAPGRGGLCSKHGDASLESRAERERARRARYAARSDDEISADLAAVLAESPDGLLPCRAGHRAPAEDFHVNRSRRSGRDDYCRAHAVEVVVRRRTAPHLPSWEDRDLFACTYCGAEYEHADHLLARRNGGPDVSLNLAPACARCNLGKSATPVDEWLDRLAAEGDPRGVSREIWETWPRVYLTALDDGTVVDVATGEVVEEADR